LREYLAQEGDSSTIRSITDRWCQPKKYCAGFPIRKLSWESILRNQRQGQIQCLPLRFGRHISTCSGLLNLLVSLQKTA